MTAQHPAPTSLEAADPVDEPLDAEDAKLVLLARGACARAAAAEGAAVRDDDGRTYSAATVALPSLQLSALQAVAAAAVSAGARTLEAAVVITTSAGLAPDDLALLGDLHAPVAWLVHSDGTVHRRYRTPSA